MIGIVNYGLGNVLAISNIYKRLDLPCRIIDKPGDFAGLTGLVLPGVGAFDWAMAALQQSGLCEEMTRLVVEEKLPVIGICVGMQMLADSSDEGEKAGLGWIGGTVRSLRERIGNENAISPHMGWNDVCLREQHPLFAEIGTDARFYFLHSYYFDASDTRTVLADAEYDGRFPCAVHKANVFGVQFHPEKSHGYGVRLLRNFARIAGC